MKSKLKRFLPSKVQEIVIKILNKNLDNFEFEELKAQEKCEELTRIIRSKIISFLNRKIKYAKI